MVPLSSLRPPPPGPGQNTCDKSNLNRERIRNLYEYSWKFQGSQFPLGAPRQLPHPTPFATTPFFFFIYIYYLFIYIAKWNQIHNFHLGAPRQLPPSATPSVAMPLYVGVHFFYFFDRVPLCNTWRTLKLVVVFKRGIGLLKNDIGVDRGNVTECENWGPGLQSPLNLRIGPVAFEWRKHIRILKERFLI